MIQILLFIVAGILFLGGLKGVSGQGIPLSSDKQLSGVPGMIAGIFVIIVALLVAWAAWKMGHP